MSDEENDVPVAAIVVPRDAEDDGRNVKVFDMVGLLDVTIAELFVDSNSDDELLITDLVLSAMKLEDPKVTDELGRTVVVGMDGKIDGDDMRSLFPIERSTVLLSIFLDCVTFSGSIAVDDSDNTVVALDAELELID